MLDVLDVLDVLLGHWATKGHSVYLVAASCFMFQNQFLFLVQSMRI